MRLADTSAYRERVVPDVVPVVSDDDDAHIAVGDWVIGEDDWPPMRVTGFSTLGENCGGRESLMGGEDPNTPGVHGETAGGERLWTYRDACRVVPPPSTTDLANDGD